MTILIGYFIHVSILFYTSNLKITVATSSTSRSFIERRLKFLSQIDTPEHIWSGQGSSNERLSLWWMRLYNADKGITYLTLTPDTYAEASGGYSHC